MEIPTQLSSQSHRLIHWVRRAAAQVPPRDRPLAFERKGPFDVVTAADTAVEAFLCEELGRHFAGDRILAEESLERRPADLSGRCWVIDPLDGTVNFLHGLPFWAISVALLEDGVPVLGVVLDAVRDELFCAERGAGAYLNGRRLRCPDDDLQRSLGASSGCLERWSEQPQVLADILARYGKIRILGSQALHLCYLAAGRLGAALSVEARLWDDAAAALVVMESGFQYTDFAGDPRFPVASDSPWLRGEAGDSLAAGAALHNDLVSIFRRATTLPSRE